MTATEPPPILTPSIPPAEEVRKRLAVVLTEADLLRKLLRLAVRHEREAARLADALRGAGGADRAP